MDFFFFFQAEDGIRDLTVTGVQTCALPIFAGQRDAVDVAGGDAVVTGVAPNGGVAARADRNGVIAGGAADEVEIGRASCRGRVEISVVAGSLKKKKKKDAELTYVKA